MDDFYTKSAEDNYFLNYARRAERARRRPIERHSLQYIGYYDLDWEMSAKRLPIPFKSKKALSFMYRTWMRGVLPVDLERVLLDGFGGGIPIHINVYPVIPGLLHDPKNLIGSEAQYWMRFGCRVVYVPVSKAAYEYLMKFSEEFQPQPGDKSPRAYNRSTFDVVIKPHSAYATRKIDGLDWAYMRFATEILSRQTEEWYKKDRHIHLLGDEQSSYLFPDWFLETCRL